MNTVLKSMYGKNKSAAGVDDGKSKPAAGGDDDCVVIEMEKEKSGDGVEENDSIEEDLEEGANVEEDHVDHSDNDAILDKIDGELESMRSVQEKNEQVVNDEDGGSGAKKQTKDTIEKKTSSDTAKKSILEEASKSTKKVANN